VGRVDGACFRFREEFILGSPLWGLGALKSQLCWEMPDGFGCSLLNEVV